MSNHREDFWYGVPGAWFGSWKPFVEGGITCSVVIDVSQAWSAFQYFQAHRRSVRITGTALPLPSHAYGEGGMRIEYVWLADERKRG